MNNIDFQQTGGFPLETDTLNFMQDTYKSLQGLAALAGDNYILSGCTVSGSSVSDGYVVINGEVMPFRGGLSQSNLIIREDKQTRSFENGQTRDVFFTRYVTFGTGTAAIPFSSLMRLKPLSLFRNLPNQSSSAIDLDDENTLATSRAVKLLNDKVETKLPAGCILIWSGSITTIPSGFALCDGQSGRPDLRDRFVLGAGSSYYVGQLGGEKDHRLTQDEMPKHRHGPSSPMGKGDGLAGRGGLAVSRIWGDKDGDYSNNLTDDRGGDQPHNNMPPYFAMAYIIKL